MRDVQYLELLALTDLDGQVLQGVIVEVQLLEFLELLNLSWNLLDIVETQINYSELRAVQNLRGELGERHVAEIERICLFGDGKQLIKLLLR